VTRNHSLTLIWVCGLIIVVVLGILWLGSLVLAVFTIRRAHGAGEIGGLVVIFVLVLLALGEAFRRFVNRLYDWWLDKRVNSMVDTYQSKVSLQFSETFKRQLRSSSTFQTTIIEAKTLAEEVAAFSAVSHNSEECDAFRKAWRARAEKFAERVAQGDPLAVEIVLKAIEKKSVAGR